MDSLLKQELEAMRQHIRVCRDRLNRLEMLYNSKMQKLLGEHWEWGKDEAGLMMSGKSVKRAPRVYGDSKRKRA